METKIKNFIEEGEKIKTEVITSVNKWGRNGDWVGNKMDEYKISLIKMIVEEISEEIERVLKIQFSGVRKECDFEEGYTRAYENMRNYLLRRHLSTLRDEL